MSKFEIQTIFLYNFIICSRNVYGRVGSDKLLTSLGTNLWNSKNLSSPNSEHVTSHCTLILMSAQLARPNMEFHKIEICCTWSLFVENKSSCWWASCAKFREKQDATFGIFRVRFNKNVRFSLIQSNDDDGVRSLSYSHISLLSRPYVV